MKHLLAIAFITLLAFGMGCAWISPTSETASDGIKVHGHWTVTVTNPDGTVDAVHEFDNKLVDWGAVLSSLLAGENLIDEYYIQGQTGTSYWHWGCQEQIYPEFGMASAQIIIPADAYRERIKVDKHYEYLTVISGICTVDLESGDYSEMGTDTGDLALFRTLLGDSKKCVKVYSSDKNQWDCYDSSWTSFTNNAIEFTSESKTSIYVKHNQKLVITVKISFD